MSRSIRRSIHRRSQRNGHRFEHDFLEVGVCQSGAPLVLPRPSGDPQHALISGTTGAGKSVFEMSLSGALAGLDDVAILGLDPKRTALGAWAPRFTYNATTISSCTRTFVWLWGENERRLDIMEAAGVNEWTTDLGGPFIVVMIDELVQVSSLDGGQLVEFMVDPDAIQGSGSPESKKRTTELRAAITQAQTAQKAQGIFLSYLARLCRSSGIQIYAATQYPMSEVVDPQIRANLGLRIMFRVTSNEMVKVCLGDGNHEDITADSISYDERGGCWIAGLGARPVRARGFSVEMADARQRALDTAHLRWPLEDVFVGQHITDANTLHTNQSTDTGTDIGQVVKAAAVVERQIEEPTEPAMSFGSSVQFPMTWENES